MSNAEILDLLKDISTRLGRLELKSGVKRSDSGSEEEVAEYVTAFDIDGASDGAYAPSVTVSADLVITSDDTLDLTLAGSGASFSAGKIRVFALLCDVSGIDETDRNTDAQHDTSV